jgi:hypothetical protein
MKNRNRKFTAILFVLAFVLAQIVQAAPYPQGGPTRPPANEQVSANTSSASLTGSEGENLPVVTITSTGDVTRGKIGSFVLNMTPPVMFGRSYVNFSVSGTAIAGVDYTALISPAYIGQSGYGTILVQTLPDPRGISQAYSVVVKLEPGAGYWVGEPSSATMWIRPCAGCGPANW